MRARGAKVDDKYGIHIHVDASRFDGKKLGILAKIVYKQEVHESGDHEFETVSDFTAAIDKENAAQKAQQDTATLEIKMSMWLRRSKSPR